MGDVSKNINRHEVACRCGCGFDTLDANTTEVVQAACDHFAEMLGVDKVVLDISSGARCEKHNRAEGGGHRSQHLRGRALDINIRGVSPIEIHAYLLTKYPDQYGIGRYPNFIHIDTRSGAAARW